ncbi:hypothetical protein CerSpe_218670 [Prunus speciosa]
MAEQRNNNRWNWEVSGFEPRKLSSSSSTASSFDHDDYKPGAPLVRRYSISAASALAQSELSNHSVTSKLRKLKDQVKLAREDYLELRQEANQFALETQARISPLINEKRRLFNDLLTAKGNIKKYCRARPLFEDEGSSIVEYPDDYNIRVNTGDDALSNPKKDFELDRVYGPHVGQAELFRDVQPLVQSALDGYNNLISVLKFNMEVTSTKSSLEFDDGGAYVDDDVFFADIKRQILLLTADNEDFPKTKTTSSFGTNVTKRSFDIFWEGSSHDCGLYARSFEELFDLANSDSTSTSRFKFSVTVFELYNEQIRDLLPE